jgi:hypothetical protein
METAASETPMIEVAKDVQRALKRAAGAKALETRLELVNNVYPLLQQILAAVDARVAPLEAAVDELLDGDEGSRIEPDLADAIKKVLVRGTQLGEMLVALIPSMDDLQRKRHADAVAGYVSEANHVALLVDDATLVEEGVVDEDGPEDDDGEGDEDDEDDEDEDDEEDTQASDDKGGA